MKKPDEEMEKTEEGFALHLRPRPVSTVSLQIPVDTLASLEKVAASRDMSPQALMKFYIGQGLRQDLTKLQSEEEISAIIREVRTEAVI